VLDLKKGTFRSNEEIAKIFKEKHIDLNKYTVLYGHGGITASAL
jgi:3-mercaptopyruvate sulfurtransferase SseA